MILGEDWAVGEEGRGEGAEENVQLSPLTPRPLSRSDDDLENHADRGGEGAGKSSPTFEMHTLVVRVTASSDVLHWFPPSLSGVDRLPPLPSSAASLLNSDRIGGIILCGGRSSRMGRAKALLPVGDRKSVV